MRRPWPTGAVIPKEERTTYLPTYRTRVIKLTPRRKIMFEEVNGVQFVKKFLYFLK
jgi:hypothetical protein